MAMTFRDRKKLSRQGSGTRKNNSLFRPEEAPFERQIAVLVFLTTLAYLYLFRRRAQSAAGNRHKQSN
jgi:hypothetical protein